MYVCQRNKKMENIVLQHCWNINQFVVYLIGEGLWWGHRVCRVHADCYLIYKQILRTAACPVRPSHIVAICSLSVCWNQVWLVSHYTSNICHWLGPTKISVDVAAKVLGWDDMCWPQDLLPRLCGQAPLWHPPWHFGFSYRPIKIR